jgi:4-amino-4-deoxy-L-arabinose transferase-like glycosyltransferase
MAWVALAALTLLRLVVAAAAPLSPDEAYYWVWSRALAPGFLDHPPMVALWIRGGTWLAGDTTLGIRLFAPLAAAAGTVLLADAAAVLCGRAAALPAAALLNATLLLGAGAVTMTPDTPLLLFWTAALCALARLQRSWHTGWWLAAGLFTGLAMASKYTGVLLLPAILLWLLAVPALRVWLLRPLPWGAAVVAAVVFLPVLDWNARHHWISFAKQGGRTGDWHPTLRYIGELIAGQLGLATPGVFLLCCAGTWRAARRRAPATTLLAAVTLMPAAVFLQHAIGDRVQGNWPAILYPSAAIAAAGLTGRLWRPAAALGFGLTALVYLQAVLAPLPLPARLDPTLRQMAGWPALAAAVAARAEGAPYVAADEYGTAALLARDLPPGIPVIGAEPRWASFALPRAAIAGRPGLLLRSARRAGPPEPAEWASAEPIGELVRGRDGVEAERYRLYRVIGRAGAIAAVMPRPEP